MSGEYAITEIQKAVRCWANYKKTNPSARNWRLIWERLRPLPYSPHSRVDAWKLQGGLPQSAIGRALHYSLQRWDKLNDLQPQTENFQIDNNLVENAIRPVALEERILFAGSHNGARRAAMLYSFLGTCKINKVNPFNWMRDTLEIIPAHPVNQLQKLLPQM